MDRIQPIWTYSVYKKIRLSTVQTTIYRPSIIPHGIESRSVKHYYTNNHTPGSKAINCQQHSKIGLMTTIIFFVNTIIQERLRTWPHLAIWTSTHILVLLICTATTTTTTTTTTTGLFLSLCTLYGKHYNSLISPWNCLNFCYVTYPFDLSSASSLSNQKI